MAIGTLALHRGVIVAATLVACARPMAMPPAPDAATAGARAQREQPFVANIRSVRGDVLIVQEESGKMRIGEILLTPGTEITTRDGAMFIPASSLRAHMRVTVWFARPQSDAQGTLLGTARRMLVDY